MGMKPTLGDVALPMAARGAGTFVSGPVAAAGQAADVLLMIHATAATGTGPTLDASLEESNDGTTWVAITGSAVAQLTAAGNRVAAASLSRAYVRVTATVAGTGPSVTFRASVMIFPE